MTRILFWGMILTAPLFISAVSTDMTWADKKYQGANTAVSETYLSQNERDVYYYVDLARMFPSRFADIYLLDEDGNPPSEGNKLSLYQDLKKMKPLPPFQPDEQLSKTAECWANEAGKDGIVGHDRKNCKDDYWAECCHYGGSSALGVVLSLLIDNGVPSLGHRYACLGSYTLLGVSIRPHKTYGNNAVLDFK
jgi:hypothetical protein